MLRLQLESVSPVARPAFESFSEADLLQLFNASPVFESLSDVDLLQFANLSAAARLQSEKESTEGRAVVER